MDTDEHNKQREVDFFITSIKYTLILLHQGYINPTLYRLNICKSVAEDLEISDLSKSINSIYDKVANSHIEEAAEELENLRDKLIQSDNSLLEFEV